MNFPDLPINGIVSGYKGAFDWLHEATSRDIIVITDPIRTGCPNHVGFDPITQKAFPVYNTGNPYSTSTPTVIPSYGINGILNIPFSGGIDCPVCNGAGSLYNPGSGVVKARIEWKNQLTTYEVLQTKLQETQFTVRIKVTGTAATDLLDRAIKIIVDGQDTKRAQEKVPVGLRDIHTYYYYLDDLQ